MKRIAISTICAAWALLSISCDKIDEKPTTSDFPPSFINGVSEAIGGENGTKAHNAYCYEVRWDGEEKIFVTNGSKSNTFTLVSGENTTKGKFKEDEPATGISGTIEAFYPSDLKQGDKYVWPAVQKNNQVSPMYAKQEISGKDEEGETVNFSSLGAILQIVFNSKTPDITVSSVTIKDVSKPMSGAFTVSSGQAILTDSSNPGITLDLSKEVNGGIKMGSSAKNFFIAIPAGTYKEDKDTVTITFTATDGRVFESTSTTFPNIARNTVNLLTFSGTFEKVAPDPAKVLSGKFTINENGDQVYFSSGNLTYDVKQAKWGFYEHQYDRASGNSADVNLISLFCWGYNATNSIKYNDKSQSNSSVTSGNFGRANDWGSVIDSVGTWRTLSNDEWAFLLKHNGSIWITYELDENNKIPGLVIFCDGYTGQQTNLDTIPENCLFLPAAGYRSGTDMFEVNISCRYWSSTSYDAKNAYYMRITSTTARAAFHYKYNGYSVRLVADVNALQE